jgi:Cys-tRNA(Pro)/Cys-tRNA(Cys) deacylase
MRILDKAKIPYIARSYEYKESNLSGTHAAAALGYDPAIVFKTIVTKGDRTGPIIFCLPSSKELDLKAAARISKNKTLEMIHVKDLPALTGYVRGGCSPIGMKKFFKTTIHESAKDFDTIMFSGGKIGYQVETTLDGLKKVIRFDLADIAE